jgi:hypothetical protein
LRISYRSGSTWGGRYTIGSVDTAFFLRKKP